MHVNWIRSLTLTLVLTSQACWALHHLAREKEGKRRMVKEEVHKLVCRTLGHPVRDNNKHIYIDMETLGFIELDASSSLHMVLCVCVCVCVCGGGGG